MTHRKVTLLSGNYLCQLLPKVHFRTGTDWWIQLDLSLLYYHNHSLAINADQQELSSTASEACWPLKLEPIYILRSNNNEGNKIFTWHESSLFFFALGSIHGLWWTTSEKFHIKATRNYTFCAGIPYTINESMYQFSMQTNITQLPSNDGHHAILIYIFVCLLVSSFLFWSLYFINILW